MVLFTNNWIKVDPLFLNSSVNWTKPCKERSESDAQKRKFYTTEVKEKQELERLREIKIINEKSQKFGGLSVTDRAVEEEYEGVT